MPSRQDTIAKHQATLFSIADKLDKLDVLDSMEYHEEEFEKAAAFSNYLEGWRAHLVETAKVALTELVRLDP